ncbi:DUF1097 domain-containing protein [Shewanella inventionis]|uniref:DUF1097 domain-containing protein n=1 Tax=Shewanella inventionis TaxID=1738770 RepID=A0ABQ1J3N9_9GAMM|nr:DUF1097 domain-containing protein [Shewanella inventionis]MCL1158962.1 DUF1097 domain-containing protein [Shewanella inventionis]UAL43065.1 DUF1097 domain-containing protein [Shewanella inventionis]GGB57219.1 hypothetical protein GCM10011607_17240 [Shewanella inventionis]
MAHRWQIAISAGLLASVWAGIADVLHLVTWVGFLGCSTFFAQTETGVKGMLMAMTTNLSGVFWGWLIIAGSSALGSPIISYALTGIVTAFMCLQASNKNFAFIPGTFIGCCITFALNADLAAIIPPLMIGAILGYSMSLLTSLLINFTGKTAASIKDDAVKEM